MDNHVAYADDPPNPEPQPFLIPEAKPMPRIERPRLNSYEKLVDLDAIVADVMDRSQQKDDDRMVLMAAESMRRNYETQVKVFETQERVKAAFAGREDITSGAVFSFLRKRCPEILSDLISHLKEARQGQG